MQEGAKLGILGGTFDPVHNGHLALADDMQKRLALDEVIFIPARLPPHKTEREITDFAHRYAMVQLAIQDYAHFTLSDLEAKRPGKSYTYDTLLTLKAAYPACTLYFLTGADALVGFTTWHRWRDILDMCTVVVTTRPGFVFKPPAELVDEVDKRQKGLLLLEKEEVDISATKLREAIADSKPWRQWLPPAVANYIQTHHLYRG